MQARSAIEHDPEAGMTLVEIVVALAIVGVMAGITVLSVGAADRGAGAETEARRLAARIALAADRALIDGKAINLVWDERGYRFDEAGVRHDLASGLMLAGPTPAGAIAIRDDSDSDPASFRLEGGGATWRVDFDGLNALATSEQAS